MYLHGTEQVSAVSDALLEEYLDVQLDVIFWAFS